MKYTIDSTKPTRELTVQEENLIDEIAQYELFLEQNQSFQICDLQRHTQVVLSGERKTRKDFIHGDNDTVYETKLLGEYFPDSDTVKLYVNNIEKEAGEDPDEVRHLMAYVFIHEFFHSFFRNTGGGDNDCFPFAEEPMAEFGSLILLDNMSASNSNVSFCNTLNCAINAVRSKQKAKGLSCAYGFGYYLYEQQKHQARNLLTRFANISNLIDPNCTEAVELTDMLYPTYSPCENDTFKKLENLLDATWELKGLNSSDIICRATQTGIDEYKNKVKAAIPGIRHGQLEKITKLHFALQQYPQVGFTYLKKSDDTYRHALGTTNHYFYNMPTVSAWGHTRRRVPDNHGYYDLDKMNWREFKINYLDSFDHPIILLAI